MDIQDAVAIITADIANLEYPKNPVKPVRGKNESNRDFGERLDAYEWEMAKYRDHVKAYHMGVSRAEATFKSNVFEALGIQDNPKREALWRMAWEDGHNTGYYDVASKAEDLVELIS